MASRYKMTGTIDKDDQVEITHIPVAMSVDRPVLFVLSLDSDIRVYDLTFIEDYQSLLKNHYDESVLGVRIHDFRFEWYKAMDKVIKLIPTEPVMVPEWNSFMGMIENLACIEILSHRSAILLLTDLSACSSIKELTLVWMKAFDAWKDLDALSLLGPDTQSFSSLFIQSLYGLEDQIKELKKHHGLQDTYFLHYSNNFKTPVILGFVPRKGV